MNTEPMSSGNLRLLATKGGLDWVEIQPDGDPAKIRQKFLTDVLLSPILGAQHGLRTTFERPLHCLGITPLMIFRNITGWRPV